MSHVPRYMGDRETMLWYSLWYSFSLAGEVSSRSALPISTSTCQLPCYVIVSSDHICRTATHKGAKFPPASACTA